MQNPGTLAQDPRSNLRLATQLTLAALLALSVVCYCVPALAQTKSLKLYNTHTKERATITFKRNGRYVRSGLNELNRFLRDWRRNEPTKMDPELFDLIYDVYRKSGSNKYIHVVSGYRSLKTNNMLRSRSRGVAKNSQHTKGHAMDFYIPGQSVAKLRAIGLRQHVGGVGYYPRSNTPFVHMDTGSVRHWPRMSRKELVKVFPKGNTIHVPTDGKPLSGYKRTLAAVKARDSGRTSTLASNTSSRSKSFVTKPNTGSKTLFGTLFGSDDDKETSSLPKQKTEPRRSQRQPDPGLRADASPANAVPTPKSSVLLANAPQTERQEATTLAAAPMPAFKKPTAGASARLAAFGAIGAATPSLKPQPSRASQVAFNTVQTPLRKPMERTALTALAPARQPINTGSPQGDVIALASATAQNTGPETVGFARSTQNGVRGDAIRNALARFASIPFNAMIDTTSSAALPAPAASVDLLVKPAALDNAGNFAQLYKPDQSALNGLYSLSEVEAATKSDLQLIPAKQNSFTGRAVNWQPMERRSLGFSS
ncbi:DUF882 domain-containing protein [Pseudovibrio hongkongensis]|uniref:DUF882 domain-containing protein n=1 Tax=Polycladidibacter hongkongensis TaxID=1647556 RepID=UPI00082B313E|nr:DUF882 domain-containing protein [Pseudovibrio hongkongensis]